MKGFSAVRYALRSLARSPGFTAAAVTTLALGIAAATVIFSVLHAVVLAPLPYREPARLQVLWERMDDGKLWRVSPATYRAWRGESRSFEDIAAFGGASVTLTGSGEPETLRGARVSPNYLRVLGVSPIAGRDFAPDDGRAGAPRMVALSRDFWAGRFGADPSILGRTLTFDGQPYTVVAVWPTAPYPAMPMTQGRIAFEPEPQFFVPVAMEGTGAPGGRSYVLGVIGRLRAGVSETSAQQEMTAFARRLRAEDSTSRAADARLRPLSIETAGATRPALWVLFAAVVLVLTIGCANVASLQLARAESRSHEIAVRAALGAGRGRIAAQLLVESLVLSVGAGVLGTVLAYWALPFLVRLVPPEVPRLSELTVHRGILAFALIVSVCAGVVSGLTPALIFSRRGAAGAFPTAGRTTTGSHAAQRGLKALVLAETGLAVVLAFGAALLTRSLLQLRSVDPGFRARSVVMCRVTLPRRRYATWESVAQFQDALLAQVRSLPAVAEAGLAYNHPLEANWIGGASVVGKTAAAGEGEAPSWFRSVSDGYFRAIGVPLARGRDLASTDDAAHPAVALVNEAFERRHFAGRTAIGHQLETSDAVMWWGKGLPTRYEIVGVVRDVRFLGLDKDPEPAYYLPARQFPLEDVRLIVRGHEDSATILSALRETLRRLDPELPMADVTSLPAVYDEALAPARLNTRLMVAFGGAALGLAMVGVYGLLSYVVAMRTRELGIRVALGASPSRVVGSVLGETARLAFAGIALGLAAALAVSRLLRGLLFGVAPADPAALGAAAASLVVVMLLASGLPARRAARIPPAQALKGD